MFNIIGTIGKMVRTLQSSLSFHFNFFLPLLVANIKCPVANE